LCVIVLSDEFYQELAAHPVPNDLDAIKALAGVACQSIPLFEDFGLPNQIGITDYSRPRRFRAMAGQWLESIHVLGPGCPARINSEGQSLVLKHAPAVVPTNPLTFKDKLLDR
jgi:hypothetical protein